jgi:hypothetical protein
VRQSQARPVVGRTWLRGPGLLGTRGLVLYHRLSLLAWAASL